MTTPAPISQRAFAKILGVSPPAVGKAIKAGRLKASLLVGADGVAKIADVDLARREWSSSTDYSKAPSVVKEQAAARAAAAAAPPPPARGPARPQVASAPPLDGELPGEPDDLNLSRENAREKHWKANKAEVEYLEHIGQLVDAAEMQSAVADAFTRVRSRLGGLPTRIRQQIPHLTVDEVGVIESFIRETLEELALRIAEDDEDEEGGDAPGDGS
jgi:hypothetical protein